MWVDDRGSVVPAPPTGARPVLLGLLWVLAGAGVVVSARVSTRVLAAAARSRAWAREWAAVEPELSGREL